MGTMRFMIDARRHLLELPRDEGLALLEWLGLGRPEFGAIEVSQLMPLCRRRLWDVRRNEGPLRRHVMRLALVLRSVPDAFVHFGCTIDACTDGSSSRH